MSAMPERLARTGAMLAATCAAFAPLGLRGLLGPEPLAGARDAGLGLLLLLLAALQSARAEASPEELDSPSARRARRFAPTAIGLLVAGLIFFPYFEAPWRQGGGAFLVLLYFVNLPLAAFWHVPAVRAVSLVVSSAAALGAVVLVPDDAAAPCLLPVAAAWALVPALDRAAAVRARLEPRPPARLAPSLRAAALVVAAGVVIFALASAVAPASTRRWQPLDLLGPARARATPPRPPDLPFGALLGLLLASGLTLAAWNAYASRAGARRRLAEVALPMDAGRAQAIDGDDLRRAVAAWPAGPRRQVVEAYLGHIVHLDARAALRQPGTTPDALARALGARLPDADAAAAARLAERFGRARWDPAPVGEEEGRAAVEEARSVERAAGPAT